MDNPLQYRTFFNVIHNNANPDAILLVQQERVGQFRSTHVDQLFHHLTHSLAWIRVRHFFQEAQFSLLRKFDF